MDYEFFAACRGIFCGFSSESESESDKARLKNDEESFEVEGIALDPVGIFSSG